VAHLVELVAPAEPGARPGDHRHPAVLAPGDGGRFGLRATFDNQESGTGEGESSTVAGLATTTDGDLEAPISGPRGCRHRR
jgi:hypothetical protein